MKPISYYFTRQLKRRIWLTLATLIGIIGTSILFYWVPRVTVTVKETVSFGPPPVDPYEDTVQNKSVADLKRLIESDPEHARNYLRDGKRSLMEVALGAKRDDDIELLLQEGWNADVMRQGEAIPQGWTPLTAAAFSGDEKLVAMLLQYGADPELCDSSGHSALQIATERGHDNVVAILKRAIHRRMHPGDTNPPLPSSRP